MTANRGLSIIFLLVIFIYLLFFKTISDSESLVKFQQEPKNFKILNSENCPNIPSQYAIVLDAGSTGSRIHIYRFNYCKGANSPKLEDEVFIASTPGLSSFVDNHDNAVSSIRTLIKSAVENVPEQYHHCTPITLKATAGLRMLPDGVGEIILKKVEQAMRNEFPFPVYHKNGVEIMGGDQEGILAWITLNFLLDKIGNGRVSTAGIMDLGGGSTQIVFEDSSIKAGPHRVELEFSKTTYILYQHSYDGYGLMQGRKQIHEASIAHHQQSTPCLPSAKTFTYSADHNDDSKKTTVVGTATNFETCEALIKSNLFKKNSCSLDPCSFDGVYMPKLPARNDVYAFSYFFDKFANPFDLHTSFTVGQIKTAANDICSPNPPTNLSPEAQKELDRNEEWCVDLGFMYSLLAIGYELPDERVVLSTKKIDGIEIGWSLGCALRVLDDFDKCKA